MTIKELAEVAGVSVDTIRRQIKKDYPGLVRRGIKTILSEETAKVIMTNVKKKNMVSVPTQNAEVPTQNAEVFTMFKMMMEQQQQFMSAVLGEIKNISKPQLQLDKPKEDYFSLLAYCSIHNIKTNRSELALHGKELRKMTLSKNLELKKIPDERWGTVNSYPVEILDEYFTV